MESIHTVGLDIAKHVFQVHAATSSGKVLLQKRVRRHQVLAFFSKLPPCTVAIEACAGSHYWGREFERIGHQVKLIAPAYVRPFVKRQKNDAADAEAICEAAQRPTMRFVAIKTEKAQAAAILFRARDLLVRQRTQIINALRGHLTEFGVIAPKGRQNALKLIKLIDEFDATLPASARQVLALLVEQLQGLEMCQRAPKFPQKWALKIP
jgi:transposase